jgi:DNA-binding NtrC family response regulator
MSAKKSSQSILLVDDEENILMFASRVLCDAFTNPILTVSDSSKVLATLSEHEVAVVVLDLYMPGTTGRELLKQIVYLYPHTQILILTASNDLETAVDCMKHGAFDYLLKPMDISRFITTVGKALEVFRLRNEVTSLKHHLLEGKLEHEAAFASIITINPKMRAIFHYIESVATSGQPVLVYGETGVGKECFAKAIHDLSGRSGKYIAVNVAGLDDQIFSDTLFGHRKGSYTGADNIRDGLIATAAGGTIFLDEIGDLSNASQVKLLRLLQEHEYYPLGADEPRRSTARVITTTNRNLPEMISSGQFRSDLYYRLSIHNCCIPPLRERQEDIPLLVSHFIEQAAQILNKKKPSIPSQLTAYLSQYSFKGNVRELQGMIFDAVAQHESGMLSVGKFCEKLGQKPLSTIDETSLDASTPSGQGIIFDQFPTLKEAEDRLITHALSRANGNQGIAARLLGMTRTALNNRLVRQRESVSQ